MARNWIVIGDPTSSGGSVLTGSSFTDIDGIPVARVTDRATCPRHKGVYPIVDGDATLTVDGQPVALHGSSLACGCKVLSAQQIRVFVDAGGGAGRVDGNVQPAAAPLAEIGFAKASEGKLPTTSPAADASTFGLTFLVQDKATGEPLEGASYKIQLASGEILEGRTGSDGMTCAACSDSAEIVSIQVSYRSESESDPVPESGRVCEACEC